MFVVLRNTLEYDVIFVSTYKIRTKTCAFWKLLAITSSLVNMKWYSAAVLFLTLAVAFSEGNYIYFVKYVQIERLG